MHIVKCVGCGHLKRESHSGEPGWGDLPLVIYECDHLRFPYWCAISGLLTPSKEIGKAAAECPVRIDRCIICGSKKRLVSFGEPPDAYACKRHYDSWASWLDQHPEKREYYSPRERIITANWFEVFLEWVDSMKEVEK